MRGQIFTPQYPVRVHSIMQITATGYRQYALLTEDPDFLKFSEFIRRHDLTISLHLNRTRVLIPCDSAIETQLLLQFPRVFRVADYSSYS